MLRFSLFALLSICLIACEGRQAVKDKKPPTLKLIQTSFNDLPAWGGDDLDGFAQAFSRSCERILKNNPTRVFGPLEQAGTYSQWQDKCQIFQTLDNPNAHNLYPFFETHFTPYTVAADDNPVGLFTGYYEASLNGSLNRSHSYSVPLHARADDLVMVQLGDFREDLKGRRIAGRVINGRLRPYEPRVDIIAGDYPHHDDVLVWVDDPVDAFFVQIQGSGIVTLDNGDTMRIGYAGQNGYPYYAIGRELIKRGALTKESVSMQSIRAWLNDNPDQADAVMNTNASYVFFRELDSQGPIGGEGIALTPLRSLAIDRSLISYGLPIWTDIAAPIDGQPPLQRLMVTQDTGGAIRGPVRGDVFWGYGAHAESMAGTMKSKGRYWILLPKS